MSEPDKPSEALSSDATAPSDTAPPSADAAPPSADAAPPSAAPSAPAPEVGPAGSPIERHAPKAAAAAEPAELTLADVEAMRKRPTYVLFGGLAAVSLFADISSKAWAEVVLSKRTMAEPSIVLIKEHLSFTLAYNKGGAWGLLHDASESVRRPFFLLVSVLAIAFIVSLYSRLAPSQRALKWGLPLVLGGALGNLSDRITRSSVIDFIDYRADWIEKMNAFIARFSKGWAVTDHWPTFNVADIFICIGVGLMAVDMVTSRRRPAESSGNAPPPPTPAPDVPASAPPAAS